MIIKLIILLAAVFAWFYFKNKFSRLSKPERRQWTYKIVLGALIAILLLGVATGRMHWLGAAVAALIPLFRFGFGAAVKFLPLWMQTNNGVASFKTEYLDIQLYIQEARFSGTILKGKFAEQKLEHLSKEELDELEQFYNETDSKSYYLLRVARQRRGAKQQQSNNSHGQQQYQGGGFSDPAREEALQILGLTGEPSKEEIVKAHRKLINKLHPDRGGNDFLAARVNQAKDVLLKGK